MNTKYLKIKELEGRTVRSVEVIPAEFGRTYNEYICITCSDGGRFLIGGSGALWNGAPRIGDMQKAPNFFSAEEIAARVLQEEKDRRQYMAQQEAQQRREYEKLRAKFAPAPEAEKE